MIAAVRNVAEEIKSKGKLKKFKRRLGRVNCKKADRVFKGNSCTKKCLKPGVQIFNKKVNRCLLKHETHAEVNIVIAEGHLNEACADGMQYNVKSKKCDFGPIGESDCKARNRSWTRGECSTHCRTKDGHYSSESGTCEKPHPIMKDCKEGFYYHKTLLRCLPSFSDLIRSDCRKAGLFWLPINQKKGRTRNGCYLRCKNKKFLYSKESN